MLIFMALVVVGCVFYVAWQLSSGTWDPADEEEPGESKESKDSPGS